MLKITDYFKINISYLNLEKIKKNKKPLVRKAMQEDEGEVMLTKGEKMYYICLFKCNDSPFQ